MKDGHYFAEPEIEVWVQNGKYHREDGPAVIRAEWSPGMVYEWKTSPRGWTSYYLFRWY